MFRQLFRDRDFSDFNNFEKCVRSICNNAPEVHRSQRTLVGWRPMQRETGCCTSHILSNLARYAIGTCIWRDCVPCVTRLKRRMAPETDECRARSAPRSVTPIHTVSQSPAFATAGGGLPHWKADASGYKKIAKFAKTPIPERISNRIFPIVSFTDPLRFMTISKG